MPVSAAMVDISHTETTMIWSLTIEYLVTLALVTSALELP